MKYIIVSTLTVVPLDAANLLLSRTAARGSTILSLCLCTEFFLIFRTYKCQTKMVAFREIMFLKW